MACESEESCVTSQQTTDSFLSDSKPTVRTSLDDYIFFASTCLNVDALDPKEMRITPRV